MASRWEKRWNEFGSASDIREVTMTTSQIGVSAPTSGGGSDGAGAGGVRAAVAGGAASALGAGVAGGGMGVTRAGLLGLARGNVWAFVALAQAALERQPGDEELRIALAGAYARMGLRTAAGEQLTALGAAGQRADLKDLQRVAAGLPMDAIEPRVRRERVRAGVEILRRRGVMLEAHLPNWEARQEREEWFRAGAGGGGNVVRRAGAVSGARVLELARGGQKWFRWAEEVGAARGPIPAMAGAATARKPGEKVAPIYVEGMDPPWLLMRLLAERPRDADGYVPRIVVIVEDPLEALDAMACADLSAMLAEERLETDRGSECRDGTGPATFSACGDSARDGMFAFAAGGKAPKRGKCGPAGRHGRDARATWGRLCHSRPRQC